MDFHKIYDSILEEYLPSRWSIRIAGLTPPLAIAGIFLPEFLQKIGIPPTEKYILALRIGLPLLILFFGTFIVLLLVLRHWKLAKSEYSKNQDQTEINFKEFSLQPEGYYINSINGQETCPRCLHKDHPKVVPMINASGPWKCVSCNYKISPKAACAGSPPAPRREGFVSSWRR